MKRKRYEGWEATDHVLAVLKRHNRKIDALVLCFSLGERPNECYYAMGDMKKNPISLNKKSVKTAALVKVLIKQHKRYLP